MFNNVNESLYNKKQKFSISGLIINIVLVIFIIMLGFEIYFMVTYKGYYICHTSMTPTLIGAPSADERGGDYIYVNVNAKPTYQDIVIVYDKNRQIPSDIVKRVVAFGGDTIKIVDGKLWLKKAGQDEFEEVDEWYIDPTYNDPKINHYYNVKEHTVADGCMYLLGDNRNMSDDSRNKANGKANGDYDMADLKGVVPKWALTFKKQTTAIHDYFRFVLGNQKQNNKDDEPDDFWQEESLILQN